MEVKATICVIVSDVVRAHNRGADRVLAERVGTACKEAVAGCDFALELMRDELMGKIKKIPLVPPAQKEEAPHHQQQGVVHPTSATNHPTTTTSTSSGVMTTTTTTNTHFLHLAKR